MAVPLARRAKALSFFVSLAVRGVWVGYPLTASAVCFTCADTLYIMSRSINVNAVASKVFESFGVSALGVSSFASWLASAGSRTAGGRAVLASLKLKAGADVTQKAVYNAIKRVYPFRNCNGKMCTISAVVGGVSAPSVVSVVSVSFIAALLEGGAVVSLPAYFLRKGREFYKVGAEYVAEGRALDSVVRERKDTRRIAEEDQRSAEGTLARAVAGGASDIEVQMALKALSVASSNCAAAVKNHEGALADFEAWRGGLSAFVK